MQCPQCGSELTWRIGCMRVALTCRECKKAYDLNEVHEHLTDEDEEYLAERRVDRF